MNGYELGLSLIGLVAQAAPGLLAAITGKSSDLDAIEAAREAVRAIPTRPAGSALDAHGSGKDT